MTTLTRKKLFELVWSKPMFKAALELGISDVGLKKACLRNNIPVPKRGHWNRVFAGRKVKTPEFKGDEAREIYIRGNSTGSPSEQRELAKKKARIKSMVLPMDESLSDLHPAVEDLKFRLEKQKPSREGFIKISNKKNLRVVITPATVQRCLAFLDAFIKSSELAGGRFTSSDDGLMLVLEDEEFPFFMEEVLDRVEHIPTEKEARKLERWQARVKASGESEDDYPWSYNKPLIPDWDYIPGGRLAFKLTSDRDYQMRRTFADGKVQRLEKMLPGIVARLFQMVVIRRERKEAARIYYEEQAARELVWEENRKKRKLEERRVKLMADNLSLWEQARQVLEYVREVEVRLEEGRFENADDVRDWLTWARDYALRLDPLGEKGPGLFRMEDFGPYEL